MFSFGPRSIAELNGVHPRLVGVVRRALAITKQDFGVHDGLRTRHEQAQLVLAGASKVMNSKHLVQPDGFGHAVDLVPFINGKLRWEWPPIYTVCEAVRTAAEELGVRIRWGGNWEELNGSRKPVHILVSNYVAVRKQIGKSAFIDGPHYELLE